MQKNHIIVISKSIFVVIWYKLRGFFCFFHGRDIHMLHEVLQTSRPTFGFYKCFKIIKLHIESFTCAEKVSGGVKKPNKTGKSHKISFFKELSRTHGIEPLREIAFLHPSHDRSFTDILCETDLVFCQIPINIGNLDKI